MCSHVFLVSFYVGDIALRCVLRLENKVWGERRRARPVWGRAVCGWHCGSLSSCFPVDKNFGQSMEAECWACVFCSNNRWYNTRWHLESCAAGQVFTGICSARTFLGCQFVPFFYCEMFETRAGWTNRESSGRGRFKQNLQYWFAASIMLLQPKSFSALH